ncbi:MAG: phosphate ABC transporter ATP-binding protein [Atopobium sp.]|nr:phosphate ABC transporter ATP-binding protein [Atopobium sp.]
MLPSVVSQEGQSNAKLPCTAIKIEDFNLWYDNGAFHALKHISLDIPERQVTAFIGPSGCGKSSLLRTFDRMCDFVGGVKTEGTLELFGSPIFAMDATSLRVKVGMVFQRPNPFPMSIRDNVLYGPARIKRLSKEEGDQICEYTLTKAALWDEVKDKLGESGLSLSGGQQQRLCIARALATNPDVLLMDEPTSALDPLSTAVIEELVVDLARDHTVVIVTHNMQQAARVADKTAFFYLGELIEAGPTRELFASPQEKRTQQYLSGRFS